MSFLNLGSIRKNLALLVILTILPAMVILFYSGMEQRQKTIEHTKKDVLLITNAMAETQRDLALSARQILSTLALLPEVQALNVQATNDIFRNFLKGNSSYGNISLVGLSGNVLASGIHSKGVNVADRKHVRDALKTKAFATGEYIEARVGNAGAMFPFAYPVFDATGTLRAVLAVAVKLATFSELHINSYLPENSYVAITDHQGARLFHYPEKSTTNPVGKPIKASNWKIASQAQEPGSMTAAGSDGTTRIVAFEQVRLNADTAPYLYVWAGVPEAFILAPADSILKRNLLLMLLTTIVALFISWGLGRKTLITPINKLMGMTTEYARGNLESRIDSTDRIDEFEKLTESFHDMAEALSTNQGKLRDSEERFRKIADLLPGMIYQNDTEGKMTYANNTGCEMLGYTQQEISSGLTTPELIAECDRERATENMRGIMAGTVKGPFTYNALRKDGGQFPILAYSARIIRDGKVVGLLGLGVPITELKQAEENLRESEKRLRDFFDNASDLIQQVGPEGELVGVNKSWCETLGYSEQEALQLNMRDIIHPEHLSRVKTNLSRVKQGGTVKVMETVFIAKDGREIQVEGSGSGYFSDGNFVMARGIFRDVTERKKAEQERLSLENQLHQKYKMEAVGVMAGGMAHNFNNNLSIILGNIELSKIKMSPNEEINDYLSNAKTAVLRSRDLIKQILTYSRQNSQDKVPTKLPLVIDETLQLLNSTLPATVNLQHNIKGDSRNSIVNADASQIQECLINLCNNAVHAMGERGDLTITLENAELKKKDIPALYEGKPGRYAKLRVQDTGCGMSAETIDKIFDLFYTTKDVDEGTGVGLSTLQGIVKQHGGVIKVNSVLGEGTCFELYFPIIERRAKERTETIQDLPRGSEKILFIDDQEPLANVWSQMLSEYGYQVTTETNSTKALKMFKEKPNQFDLVITDQTMPDVTGKELIKELLEIKPELPTILCTGYSTKIDEEETKQLGIKAFCMKPLDLPQILHIIRQVLDE